MQKRLVTWRNASAVYGRFSGQQIITGFRRHWKLKIIFIAGGFGLTKGGGRIGFVEVGCWARWNWGELLRCRIRLGRTLWACERRLTVGVDRGAVSMEVQLWGVANVGRSVAMEQRVGGW